MFYQIKSYLKFLLRSTNQHGIHSPFVYNLVAKCFYDTTKYEAYTTLNNYRKRVFSNNDTINITDFGAGSRVFKSNERSISKIARHSGISKKKQQLLFRLVSYFNVEKSLELGTSLGLATSALALGNPNGTVDTVEGCENTAAVAKTLFTRFQLNNINLEQATFDAFLKSYTETPTLIYIDGNHSKKNTINYFNFFVEKLKNDSFIIFDDIYWSQEMTQAWHYIKDHPKVSVSIDTFYWGIVFFRIEQEKQHFTIRL